MHEGRPRRTRTLAPQALRNIAAASSPKAVRRSSRLMQPEQKTDECKTDDTQSSTQAHSTYILYSNMVRSKSKPKTNKISAGLPKIPSGPEEAMSAKNPFREQWMGAMQREWNSHCKFPSVEVADWPKNGKKVFRCLWVYDVKLDPNDPSKLNSELDEKGF